MRVPRDRHGIPIVDNWEIEGLAEHFLSQTAPRLLGTPLAFPIAELVDQLTKAKYCTFSFDEDLGEDSNGKRCLGYYSLSRRHIAIDLSLSAEDPRLPFTFAHELGHFYLHGRVSAYAINQNNAEEIRDTSEDILTFRIDGARPRTRIEWQANRFASALLVPRQTLPSALDFVQREIGIARRGRVYLDHQPQNQRDYRKILLLLSNRYRVSQSVVRYRLRDMGLLQEHASFAPQSMRQSVEELLRGIFVA
jgi:Zn-dependent peptidase ImmA (M78 family)